jgi:anti-anti-sigma factor
MTASERPRPGPPTRWLEGAHTALIHKSRRVENERVGTWMAGALNHGQQVFYKHAEPGPAVRQWLTTLLGSDVLDSYHVQLIDAARCHADTGGRPAALRDWHSALIEQARDAGHRGVAIVCDGAALRTITPDPPAMLTHERDLTQLAATYPLTVLCRYDTATERPTTLHQLVGVHSALDDITFAARRDLNRLVVCGDIDASNADRFAAILRAAIDEGIRIVDVGEVQFFAAAGLHVLHDALPPLRAAGQTLALYRPHGVVRRMLEVIGLSKNGTLIIAD